MNMSLYRQILTLEGAKLGLTLNEMTSLFSFREYRDAQRIELRAEIQQWARIMDQKGVPYVRGC